MCFYFLIISRWLYSLSLFFCYFVQKCFICCNALLWNLEWWIDPTEHFFCNALCFSLCVPLVTQQYIKNSLWRSDFCVDFCTACRQMFDSPCACVPWRLLVGLRRSTRYHYSSQFHQSGVCIFRFSSVIVCVFFSSRFFNTLLFGARRTQKEDGERKIEQEGFPMQKGRIEHGSHLRFQIQVEWWKWQILSSSAPPGTTNCSWRTRLLVSLPSVWSEKAWSLVGISHWKLMKIFTLDLSLVQARLCRHLKLTESDLTLQLRAAQQDRQLLSNYSRPHSLSENLQQVWHSTRLTFTLLQKSIV